jgi:hypothetical protein
MYEGTEIRAVCMVKKETSARVASLR